MVVKSVVVRGELLWGNTKFLTKLDAGERALAELYERCVRAITSTNSAIDTGSD